MINDTWQMTTTNKDKHILRSSGLNNEFVMMGNTKYITPQSNILFPIHVRMTVIQ